MRHKTLEKIVNAYIEVLKNCGHSDARILKKQNLAFDLHAGIRDEWHPCGYNERLTPNIVRRTIALGGGYLYDAARAAGVIDVNPHDNGDVYETVDYEDTRYIGRINYDGIFFPAVSCRWNDDDIAEKLQRLILDPPKEVSWPQNQRVFAARHPSPEIIARYLWDEQHLSPNTTIHVWLTAAGFSATTDSWEYRDEDIVHLATISFGDNVPLNREELEESLIEATI